MLIGLAPQFIKNGVLLGAPLAPLGTTNIDWLMRERWYDATTVSHIRFLYPFVLTFGEYFAQYGQLSVLVLAFLPLALFLRRPETFRRSPLTAVTAAAWVAIAGWAGFQGDKVVTRYLLPVLLLCIPLAAAAAEHVTKRSFRPCALGVAVIAACFATLYITANFSTGLFFPLGDSEDSLRARAALRPRPAMVCPNGRDQSGGPGRRPRIVVLEFQVLSARGSHSVLVQPSDCRLPRQYGRGAMAVVPCARLQLHSSGWRE